MKGASPNRITAVTRRDIVDGLLLREKPFHGRMGLIDFLKRVWDLGAMPSTDARFDTLEEDVQMHTVTFSDWDDGFLLYDRLSIVDCPDEVFGNFVSTVLHPLAQQDRAEASKLADEISALLVHDGFRLEQESEISGRPVYRVVECGRAVGVAYEVVLSFAGEQRDYVEALPLVLEPKTFPCSTTNTKRQLFGGKDLVEHLQDVYGGGSRFCVIFISKEYVEKVWPNYERQNASAKAISEKQEYVLPAWFDDTPSRVCDPPSRTLTYARRRPPSL